MNKIILLVTLLISQIASAEFRLKSQYSFVGLNLGVTSVSSGIDAESNNKEGFLYGGTVGHEFKFTNDFNLNLGLEYNKHKF
jgi:hypothetical protein